MVIGRYHLVRSGIPLPAILQRGVDYRYQYKFLVVVLIFLDLILMVRTPYCTNLNEFHSIYISGANTSQVICDGAAMGILLY